MVVLVSTMAAGPFPEGRRASAAWLLLGALACGLAAGTVAVRSVAEARREQTVVVARRAVAPMSRVGASDVVLSRVPEAALPPGAERVLDGVVGQFTRAGLVPGEVVTDQALAGVASGASDAEVRLAALLVAQGCPPEKAAPAPVPGSATASSGCADWVAMTLPMGADQGFGIVRPGDRVDLVASYGLAQGTAAQVVVADVSVLDHVTNAQAAPVAGPGPAAPSFQSGWIVVAVTPAQALRLQLAEASGKVAVLLRPMGASAQDPGLEARVLTVPDLAGGISAGPPAPPTAGVLAPPTGSLH